ncbi:MAG: GtrA family protein [Chromatiales bacterium]|jgi:putative flippase GtrA|nr:GtrA family protein [Chromatiales bacterium]MDX9768248.1 GtrA family protein [Ectothiorhodospiraceae bacterium]
MHGTRTQAGRLSTQFLTFATVGGIATAAHYAVLALLVEMFDVAPVPASALGYLAGMVTGYLLNYRFTFRSNKRHHEAFARFALVAMMGLLLNTAIMTVGVIWLGLHYLPSQIIATGLTLFWNFAANRIWTFREDAHAER